MEGSLPKILCVDDEPHILKGLERSLFESFDIETARNAEEALMRMSQTEYEVVVSDMRMPNMDGAELLKKARLAHPDTTRILLTGQAELDAAMKAINEGDVFRFLLKPCDSLTLTAQLNEAVKLHRLKTGEKELLEKTLKGSIKVLSEILSIAAPEAFRTSLLIRRLTMHVVKVRSLPCAWEYDIAAMLSQLGALALPNEVLERAFQSTPLEAKEEDMLLSIPRRGAQLIERIPRLERVAMMIAAHQDTDEQLEQLPEEVETGARLLRCTTWLAAMKLRDGVSVQKALDAARLRFRHPQDVTFLQTLSSYSEPQDKKVLKAVCISELKEGMVLEEDVTALSGSVVLSKGKELTEFLIGRLNNFARGAGVNEPIKVYC